MGPELSLSNAAIKWTASDFMTFFVVLIKWTTMVVKWIPLGDCIKIQETGGVGRIHMGRKKDMNVEELYWLVEH